MSFTITLDKDHKIIKYKSTGVLDKSNMGKAWGEIVKMREFYELGYNTLSNYCDAEFKFSLDETNLLDEYIYTIRKLLKGKKGAVVVDVPVYTAISVLVIDKFKDLTDFEIKIFSTEEAAIKWLLE
jgi:hypothetical protein